MYSNALSAQPKLPSEVDEQVDELCAAFGLIAKSMPERLDALRKIKDTELAAKLLSLKHHTFRPVTDGDGAECFIPPGSANLAETRDLAAWMQRHGIKIMLGETEHEERTYRAVNPPTSRATLQRNVLQTTMTRKDGKMSLARSWLLPRFVLRSVISFKHCDRKASPYPPYIDTVSRIA
jgi:carboxylesterase type B